MSARRPFVTDAALTGIAIGYRNTAQMLIADRVLPRVPVMDEKFKWNEFPLAEGFTVPDTRVGRKGRVNRVEFSAKEKTDSVDDFGLEGEIPNSDIDAARAQREAKRSTYDPENHTAESLTDLVLLDREVRVAAVVQDPNNYAPARRVALAGGSMFSDYANSDPIAVIKAALSGTLVFRPNTMVMGQKVWDILSSHPVLVNAIRGNATNKGIITKEELAKLFEVKEVLVGESFINTGRKGQAANLNRVWGNSLQLLYIDPLARTDDARVTWGMTAQYGTRIAGRMEDANIGLEGGRIIRVGERVKELVVAKDVGYQIQNAVPAN